MIIRQGRSVNKGYAWAKNDGHWQSPSDKRGPFVIACQGFVGKEAMQKAHLKKKPLDSVLGRTDQSGARKASNKMEIVRSDHPELLSKKERFFLQFTDIIGRPPILPSQSSDFELKVKKKKN